MTISRLPLTQTKGSINLFYCSFVAQMIGDASVEDNAHPERKHGTVLYCTRSYSKCIPSTVQYSEYCTVQN